MTTAMASGVGRPASSAPVVDMIEHRLRTRAGCVMARVWAIMPPIDVPTTWASSMPSASRRPAVSSAMSSSV